MVIVRKHNKLIARLYIALIGKLYLRFVINIKVIKINTNNVT